MTRDKVYTEIDRERAYQKSLPHTDGTETCSKSVGDYINLLGYYAEKARSAWVENMENEPVCHMIRKLAACAVACLEAHECPPRMVRGWIFPLPNDEQTNRRSDITTITLESMSKAGGHELFRWRAELSCGARYFSPQFLLQHDALQWRIEHPDIEKDWRLAAFVKVNEGMRDEAEALASTGSPKPGWMEA
ncbi:MAG TPA: hypothetical protein VM656_13050, partial [Pyrinomonadaceae bacterium]|nr:hypothetical protein [Pyrinomonadaceae bacterium]